jgi:hypothetical protein
MHSWRSLGLAAATGAIAWCSFGVVEGSKKEIDPATLEVLGYIQ